MTKTYITVKEWLLISKKLYATNNNDIRNGYKYNTYSEFVVTAETDKAYNTIIGWIPKSAVIKVENRNDDEIAIDETIKQLLCELENETDKLERAIIIGALNQRGYTKANI